MHVLVPLAETSDVALEALNVLVVNGREGLSTLIGHLDPFPISPRFAPINKVHQSLRGTTTLKSEISRFLSNRANFPVTPLTSLLHLKQQLRSRKAELLQVISFYHRNALLWQRLTALLQFLREEYTEMRALIGSLIRELMGLAAPQVDEETKLHAADILGEIGVVDSIPVSSPASPSAQFASVQSMDRSTASGRMHAAKVCPSCYSGRASTKHGHTGSRSGASQPIPDRPRRASSEDGVSLSVLLFHLFFSTHQL